MNKEHPNNPPSFNEAFCLYLEYHLGKTFAKSGREDLKGFWCDGIAYTTIPDPCLTADYVNDQRKIETKAWIGKDGQDVYGMTIRLGKQALRCYAQGTDLTNCIPEDGAMDWIDINIEKREIEIRLT